MPIPSLPWLTAAAALAASVAVAPAASVARPSNAIALDNVRIVDVERARSAAPRCVRVEDGRIVRIARPASRSCRRDADTVDMQGRYLMPGLIDMHAHLTLGPLEMRRERGQLTMVADPDDAIAAHNARRLVAFGVTTIRNPGGDLAAAARYREALDAGRLTGPESFDAGPVINNTAIRGLAAGAASADEVRRVVDAQVEAGADWIKLYTGLDREQLRAGIEAAHAHGRPAVAHLEAIAWPDALEMGLDGIVHLMPTSPDLLDPQARRAWQADARAGTFAFFEWWEHFDPDGPGADRLVAAFQRHRPVFDATLVAFHAAFVQDLDNDYKVDARRYAHPALQANWNDWFTFAIGWKPEDFARARAIWPKVQRLAVRLYATDARMTLGTDMSNPWIAPGISLHREMQLLADAGVATPTILRAATVNAARALGAERRLGRVALGHEADLLVLDADPLDDIRNTRAIHAVVLDGRLLDNAALDSLKGE
ncbi:amidohydrolase family protein [Marilutibacter alkalisoli]|uniref:Amidohydrolase family protein n=1 Tax=Marilutibacter alkalisoli TaxID=2591633 RepID=A0A514BV06_9GAMM|nr:amidohydrolase family protein [Lysobacter alkalisoli]QDH71206.1 amidohydrolase family protein [Lysobacter alkalisoli]